MNTQTRNTLTMAAGLVILIAMVGCSSDAPVHKGGPTSLFGASPIQVPDVANAAGVPAPAAEKTVGANPLQTIYFAQNESTLSDDAKEILKKNADWLNDNPPYRLEVDAYADSRGTPEQALAMSQRRAAAIRDYYAVLGIPKQRIATIAFGQTDPVCVQESEDCWKQNRRVETHVDNKPLAER